MGHSTLHVDTAKYYGGDWAAFTWDGLQEWVAEEQSDFKVGDDVNVDEGEELLKLGDKKTVLDIKERWFLDLEKEDPPRDNQRNVENSVEEDNTISGNEGQEDAPNQDSVIETKSSWNEETLRLQSRKFNLDLTPRLLFARGPMVELLISSNISRYTEFKSVTRVLTLLEGKLEQVPSSRSDVFNTKHISVVEKRVLMKFLTQCLQEEEGEQECDRTFGEFLKAHKLTPNLMHYVCHSIAMVQPDAPQITGLKATRKFLSSLGRFGPTPFLWSMYGTGELPQAFCRLCAVFGGIYYLGKSINGVLVKDQNATGIIIENKKIKCDHLVIPSHQLPTSLAKSESEKTTTTSRSVFVTQQSLLPSDKEQITFLSLPQETGPGIQVIEVGAGAAATPRGLHLMHVSAAGKLDLEMMMKIKNIVTEDNLVYSLSFNQTSVNQASVCPNIWPAPGPGPELDFDQAIADAKNIYNGMFPEEEFLPRAPDPEEIIFGEDENKDQDNDDSHQKVDSESTEVNPESTEVNPETTEVNAESTEVNPNEDLISKNESDIDDSLKSP